MLVDPDFNPETLVPGPVPEAQKISQNVIEAMMPAAARISYRDILVRGKIDA